MKLFKKSISFISAILLAAGMNTAVFADELEEEAENYSGSRVYGDLNGDDIVNIKDILVFSKLLVSGADIDGDLKCIDLDLDGKADICDLTMLKDGILNSGANRVGMPVYDDEHMKSEGISGIDVSRWQGEIDWQGVKDSGIEFVMIKAGEGVEEEIKFRQNIEGAKSVGINCGVYWFASAQTVEDAVLEAKACLETIAGYELEYPVAYDFEYRTVDNKPIVEDRELMTQIVKEFLLYIQKEGYYPILYSNLDFLKHYFIADDLGQFDLWYARYNIKKPDMPCFIWQRSCTGRIGGIDVNVDLDMGYKDFAEVIRKYQWNHWESYQPPVESSLQPETTETETTETDETIETAETTEPPESFLE